MVGVNSVGGLAGVRTAGKWELGKAGQFSVLKVDFDGDGVASREEFGSQRR